MDENDRQHEAAQQARHGPPTEEGKIPLEWVQGGQAVLRRGRVLWLLVIVAGLGIIVTGIGSAIAVNIANGTTHRVQVGSQKRTDQVEGLVKRLANQQEQITALTRQLADTQQRSAAVLCTAVISGIEQTLASGQTQPRLHETIGFLKQYGCTIPANLVNR